MSTEKWSGGVVGTAVDVSMWILSKWTFRVVNALQNWVDLDMLCRD